MKRSFISRIAALEGLEEDSPEEGLDTDQVIDEDEDKEGDAEPADPADEAIEYPDVGNLEVDEVHDQLTAEHDARQERVRVALDATEPLNRAMEALLAVHIRDGRINPELAKSAAITLEHFRARVGFTEPSKFVALENYCGFTARQSSIALEAIMETLSNIWKAVVTAIEMALAWLKKAFIKFFVGVERDTDATKSLTQSILTQRKKPKFEQMLATSAIDQEHYVAIKYHQFALTFNGKQPGQYHIPVYGTDGKPVPNTMVTPTWPEAMGHLLELVETHAKIDSVTGKYLVKGFTAVNTAIQNGTVDKLPKSIDGVNTYGLLPSGYMLTDDKAGMTELPNFIFLKNDFYISGFFITHRIYPSACTTLEDQLISLGGWQVVWSVPTLKESDGWMRNLLTDELKETSEVVVKIENTLLDCEKTLDKLQHVQDEFKKMAAAAANWSSKMPADHMDKSSANGWRGSTITLLIRAINGVVANANSHLYQCSSRVHLVCRAWNVYLKEIYLKETEMMKKA